jgi:hypothetical protein
MDVENIFRSMSNDSLADHAYRYLLEGITSSPWLPTQLVGTPLSNDVLPCQQLEYAAVAVSRCRKMRDIST